ncbi:hypothetical protein SLA2020_191130 [Shorea laevis]
MPQQQNQHHSGPNRQEQPQVVVVMVPSPAQGHLNQLLQLSRLLLCHHIPVHYGGTATHVRQAKLRVHGWDPLATADVHFHSFEIPPFLSPPPDPNATIKFPSHLQPTFDASLHLRAPLAKLLRFLSVQSKRVMVIHDSLMGSVIQDVSLIPNAESYTFHSVSAFAYFLYIWEKQGKPIKATSSLKTLIFNTSKIIEGTSMELLEQTVTGEKHRALGPFNAVQMTPEKRPSNVRSLCLEWLDRQAANSVIYVSLGTTTTMSNEQTKELAMGLKQSGQKFIWVLRYADKGDVFAGEEGRRPQVCEPLRLEFLFGEYYNGSSNWGVAYSLRSTEEHCVDYEIAQGGEVRRRAAELGDAVRLSVAEGGVSHEEWHSFISHISR